MSSLRHERLLNEATRFGTGEILRRMPTAYSPELEQAIRHGVRQALLYYNSGLDALAQQLPSLDDGKTRP